MAKKREPRTSVMTRLDEETLEILRRLEGDWPQSARKVLNTSRASLLRLLVRYANSQIEKGDVSLLELIQREIEGQPEKDDQ